MSETTMMQLLLWFHVAVAGGVAALAWWLPALTRRDLYFAVTVEPAWRAGAEGRQALAVYRRWWVALVLLPVVAAVVCALALEPTIALYVVTAAIMVEVVGLLAGFLAARRRVLPAAVESADRPAAEPVVEARLPGGWLGQAGPFLIVAAAALVLALAWDAVPDRYPVHYDASFQPDGWAERSLAGVAMPFALALVFMLPMWWMQWALVRRAHQAASGGGAASEVRRRVANAEVLLGAVYLIAADFAVIALAPLFQGGRETARAWLTAVIGFTVVGTFGLIAWLVVRLLPLYAARRDEGATGAALGDRTADEHWKMGLFYYNPGDPSLFIEKRFGIGYTMNMARPVVWGMLGALLVLPLLLILLFTL